MRKPVISGQLLASLCGALVVTDEPKAVYRDPIWGKTWNLRVDASGKYFLEDPEATGATKIRWALDFGYGELLGIPK